ncbi:MAG: DUF4180 domain-containing protein [Actinobacteria bacterium]|nr:DUF4180 domain-containing protein [Actinomycetota bacterium]
MNEDRRIVIAADSGISIKSINDISEAVGACFGAAGLIITEDELAPELFDLQSGLAGELFQKFTNYDLRLAIVVPDVGKYGERLIELASEHATHRTVRVFDTIDSAQKWMSGR